ncbi:MAG TPA: response regulator [Candidatus Limnocylindrales bacterium]|nr:response regulator [Candidatus Limnocylindrales bacterium]
MDGEARILIVEDDADLAGLLLTTLGSHGYEVRAAGDGAEALRLIHDEEFQLVILDILLPDTTGFDLCNHLREQRRTQSWPILFLTEMRDRSDRLHGLELGVVDYITKPFDMTELRLRIRNTLQRASQHSIMNAITELPDTPLVSKRLERLAESDSDWALVLLAADGLTHLRETYGFLAVDELMRVLAMIAQAAVRDLGGRGDFAGHYDASTLVVFTAKERAAALRDRIAERVTRTLDGLYLPLDDARTFTMPHVQTTLFHGTFDSPEALLEALSAERRALSASAA